MLPPTGRTVLIELDTSGTLLFLQLSANLQEISHTGFEDGKVHLFLEKHGDDILDVKLGDLLTYGVGAQLPSGLFTLVDTGAGASELYLFSFAGALTSDYLRFEYEPTDPSAQTVHAQFALIRVNKVQMYRAKVESYEELLEQVKLLRKSLPARLTAR